MLFEPSFSLALCEREARHLHETGACLITDCRPRMWQLNLTGKHDLFGPGSRALRVRFGCACQPGDRALRGYWGPVSSSIDWCERNHVVTPYIAEFYNTCSNLAMVLLGLLGMYLASREGHEKRYIVTSFTLFAIGCGGDGRKSDGVRRQPEPPKGKTSPVHVTTSTRHRSDESLSQVSEIKTPEAKTTEAKERAVYQDDVVYQAPNRKWTGRQ